MPWIESQWIKTLHSTILKASDAYGEIRKSKVTGMALGWEVEILDRCEKLSKFTVSSHVFQSLKKKLQFHIQLKPIETLITLTEGTDDCEVKITTEGVI